MWSKLLIGGSAERAAMAIAAILDDLRKDNNAELSAVACGERALLFTYLALDAHLESLLPQASSYLEEALFWLSSCVNCGAAETSTPYGLFGGLCNIGWLIQHVSKYLIQIDPALSSLIEPDEILGDLDQMILRRQAASTHENLNYDLINGQTGLGVYWLERNCCDTNAGISKVVASIMSLSQIAEPGRSWFTAPQLIPPIQANAAPYGYYNLGVAHGVPGVMGLLSRLTNYNFEYSTLANTMLDESLRWLLAQQRAPSYRSRYSGWTLPGYVGQDSRLAWCYGDLGIGAVLQMCSERQPHSDGYKTGLRLLERCTTWSLSETGIVDASLCHGAVGAAHIFNRAYQRSGSGTLATAAKLYYEYALLFRMEKSGAGDFFAYNPTYSPPHHRDDSVLSGSIGVALSLLASVSTVAPSWDSMMLLSDQIIGGAGE